MPSFDAYFQSPGRGFEIVFGIGLLAPAAFFGFFGATGAWAYLHGSRAAPADPLASGIGLGVAVWLTYLSVRLISGRRSEKPLLPNLFLLLAALGSIAGAIWAMFLMHDEPLGEQMKILEVFGITGIGGLILLWRRLKASGG